MKTLEQFQKELTPAEAYQALLDGKVIHKPSGYLKTDGHNLLSSQYGDKWTEVTSSLLLHLTGYRLARKKVKKEVKCWVNFYDDGDFVAHDNKEDAIGGSGKRAIATAVEMTGYYEVWEDEE